MLRDILSIFEKEYLHCLQSNLEVEGTDGYCAVLLPWPHPGFLHNSDITDASTGNHQVRVGVGYIVNHDEGSVTVRRWVVTLSRDLFSEYFERELLKEGER